MLRRDLRVTSPAMSPAIRSRPEDGSGAAVEKVPVTVSPVESPKETDPLRPIVTPHSPPSERKVPPQVKSSESAQRLPPLKVKVSGPAWEQTKSPPSPQE